MKGLHSHFIFTDIDGSERLDDVLKALRNDLDAIRELVGMGGGIPPRSVSGISVLAASEKVSLMWTDPEDSEYEGEAVNWAGTCIVRTEGAPPESINDGVLILNNQERNAYKDKYFTDGGLVNGVDYYYQFFPYSETGAVNKNGVNRTMATPGRETVYAVPSQKGVLTYTGLTQFPEWNNYDGAQLTISGVIGAADAGTHTALFTPTENYQWPDGTVGPKAVTWVIGRAVINAVPSQSGTLTYTGSSLTPVWSGYDSAKMKLSGVVNGTNAGTYAASFEPLNNYKWQDGTTEAKSVNWTIGEATIASVPSQSGSLTYTGSSLTPLWSGYDSTKMKLSGVVSGTNAGTYAASFEPLDNYKWQDGTTEAKSVDWKIGKATIASVPSQSGSLIYTGSMLSPSWSGYDSGKMTESGTAGGTAAGTYTAAFTPLSNYQWQDGTTTAKSVNWTIDKAAGSLSINVTSLTLNSSSPSGTITATRSGSGTVSAVSSDTTVATVSVVGSKATVYNVNQKNGTATITIKVAADSNHNAPADKTCSVTCSFTG